ncbi:MAG: LppP/LprE family lipoprotein [Solirubrobacteraceae bacterium]
MGMRTQGRWSLHAILAVPAIAGAVLMLAGCGSNTKTVSVSSAPIETNTTSSTSASSASTSKTTSATTTATTSSESPTTTTTQASTASRTSSKPAFVERGERQHTGPLAAAVATVEHAGYVPQDTSQYHASQTLRVLIGRRSGSGGSSSGAYTQQAFFFVDGRYIGTDASQPSAAIELVSESDTEVVLAYGLFDSTGASVGKAEVHFQLDNGKLEALDPIPPTHPSARSGGRL